jgi:hypothetical protein
MPALADRAREVLPSGLTGLAGLACAVLRHPGATTRTQPPDLDRQGTPGSPQTSPQIGGSARSCEDSSCFP